MRIVKEDENLMVLKDENIMALAVGVIFFMAGLVVIIKPEFFINQPPFWSGIAGICFGAFIITFAKITTLKLDKQTNKLTFLQKGLMGKHVNEYDLNQIKAVDLAIAYNNHAPSKKGGGFYYYVAFILNNGEMVQLKPGSSAFVRVMGQPIMPEKTLAMRVANFLGVPFQERRPPTVSETLSAVSSAIQNAAKKEIDQRKDL
jgi:hypothetical protein